MWVTYALSSSFFRDSIVLFNCNRMSAKTSSNGHIERSFRPQMLPTQCCRKTPFYFPGLLTHRGNPKPATVNGSHWNRVWRDIVTVFGWNVLVSERKGHRVLILIDRVSKAFVFVSLLLNPKRETLMDPWNRFLEGIVTVFGIQKVQKGYKRCKRDTKGPKREEKAQKGWLLSDVWKFLYFFITRKFLYS